MDRRRVEIVLAVAGIMLTACPFLFGDNVYLQLTGRTVTEDIRRLFSSETLPTQTPIVVVVTATVPPFIQQSTSTTQPTAEPITIQPTPTPAIPLPSLTTPNPLIASISFVVQAKAAWQDAGIQVQSGDLLHITYVSGEWTGKSGVGGLSGPYFGPAPENTDECFPIRGEGPDLVGRIGTGTPFIIGYEYNSRVQDMGNLQLRMNDCDKWLYDNAGSITVNIQQSR